MLKFNLVLSAKNISCIVDAYFYTSTHRLFYKSQALLYLVSVIFDILLSYAIYWQFYHGIVITDFANTLSLVTLSIALPHTHTHTTICCFYVKMFDVDYLFQNEKNDIRKFAYIHTNADKCMYVLACIYIIYRISYCYHI